MGRYTKTRRWSALKRMGFSLKLKREFLRCISSNSLKTFRNGFIGRNRRRPASPSIAGGQPRPKIRLLWQKSSLSGLLSWPASGLLSVIFVLDDNHQRKYRDEKRFIVRADEKLTAFSELQRTINHPQVPSLPITTDF